MKKSLLDLEISGRLKYQMMFFACALIHAVFFTVFSFAEIYMLMTLNIFSVIFYIVGAYACGTKSFEKHVLKWIIMIYAEITFHAVACTVHLGFGTYFFLYAMVELSISAYMLYFSCDKKIFIRMLSIFVTISFAALAGCQIYFNFKPPVYEWVFGKNLTPEMENIIRVINIIFCTGAIFVFSLLFVIEINLLITKLNSAYDKLTYTAMHDSLTGLYNRHSLRDFFDSLTESGNEYCVALGDIDNFKKVNDTYGHDCGDEVLVTVSDIIKSGIAEQDLACRWGGEEILIIMRGKREDCLDRMNGIRSRINASVVESGNTSISVTMTFGFADCHEVENSDKNRMDSLVILVDGRLYVGKKSGKNVIVSEEAPEK